MSLPRRASLAAFALSGLLCVGYARPAQAEEVSAANKAAARDLAIEGIQLAQAGKCEDALPKLERAEALYHAPTILTWIGECQIQQGRLVEGTENLNKVLREELADNAPTAFAEAKKRASALIANASPRIGRLTVHVEPAELEGLRLTIDGRPFAQALVGTPRPTDPGTHQLRAEAPGYQPARAAIELGEGGREELRLVLVLDPTAVTPPSSDETPSSGLGTQTTLGWIGVGAGSLLTIGGGITGLMAIGAKNELTEDLCPQRECATEEAQSKYNQANTFALTSTVLFSAGGALLATGLVLLIVGDPGPVEASVAGLTLRPSLGLSEWGVNGQF